METDKFEIITKQLEKLTRRIDLVSDKFDPLAELVANLKKDTDKSKYTRAIPYFERLMDEAVITYEDAKFLRSKLEWDELKIEDIDAVLAKFERLHWHLRDFYRIHLKCE